MAHFRRRKDSDARKQNVGRIPEELDRHYPIYETLDLGFVSFQSSLSTSTEALWRKGCRTPTAIPAKLALKKFLKKLYVRQNRVPLAS